MLYYSINCKYNDKCSRKKQKLWKIYKSGLVRSYENPQK